MLRCDDWYDDLYDDLRCSQRVQTFDTFPIFNMTGMIIPNAEHFFSACSWSCTGNYGSLVNGRDGLGTQGPRDTGTYPPQWDLDLVIVAVAATKNWRYVSSKWCGTIGPIAVTSDMNSRRAIPMVHGLQNEKSKMWVCLKIGYIPNYSHLIGIMISKTIGFRGANHFQTHPCLDGCGGGDPKESLSGLGGPLAHRGLWPGDEAQEGHGDFHRTTDCWHVLWQTAGPFGWWDRALCVEGFGWGDASTS